MKWTFIIQQKIKVVVLLTSLIVLIGVTNYIEQRNISQIHESVNSIYYDRLIPATEFMHITQNLYKQRMLLENAVLSDKPNVRKVEKALNALEFNTEERIVNFEKTYLVKHESYALVIFKNAMHDYKKIEDEIIYKLYAGETEQARALYHEGLGTKFSKTLTKVEDLASIQRSVGRDMLEQSKSTISYSSIVLTLQIIAAILIGVMTHGLVMASRVANVNPTNFHLN